MSIPEGFNLEAANQRVVALGEQFPDIGEKIDVLRAEIESSGKSLNEAQFMIAEVLGLSYEASITTDGETVFRSSAPPPIGDDVRVDDMLCFEDGSNLGTYYEEIDGEELPSAKNPKFDPVKYAPQIPDSVIELRDSPALVELVGAVDGVLSVDREKREETGVQSPPQGIIKHLTFVSAASKAHDFGVPKESKGLLAKNAAFGLLTEADKYFCARANLHTAGFCVEQDMDGLFGSNPYEDAIKNFRIAAQNGDAKAETALGYYYLRGDENAGVEKDPTKAREYFERAVSKGNVEAMVVMADAYAQGNPDLNVEKDRFKAASLAQEAKEAGDEGAKRMLEEELATVPRSRTRPVSETSKINNPSTPSSTGFFASLGKTIAAVASIVVTPIVAMANLFTGIFGNKAKDESVKKEDLKNTQDQPVVRKDESQRDVEISPDLESSRAARVETMSALRDIKEQEKIPDVKIAGVEERSKTWVERVGGPKSRDRISHTPDEGAVR